MNTLNLKIDKDKCIKCAKCTNDCITSAIKQGNDGYPVEINPAYCISCQHCLMVCPVGALSIFDKDPSNSSKIENKVKEEDLFNLIQSRRSIRKFKDENVSKEDLNKLKQMLNYTPTGCNRRGLYFSFIEDRNVMEKFRSDVNKKMIKVLSNPFLSPFLSRYKTLLAPIKEGQDVIFRSCPHLVALSVSKDSPCRDIDPIIALSYFELYAYSLNIGTCWCGFAQGVLSKIPSLQKALNIPKTHKLSYVMLFGYPDIKYQRTQQPKPYTFYTVK